MFGANLEVQLPRILRRGSCPSRLKSPTLAAGSSSDHGEKSRMGSDAIKGMHLSASGERRVFPRNRATETAEVVLPKQARAGRGSVPSCPPLGLYPSCSRDHCDRQRSHFLQPKSVIILRVTMALLFVIVTSLTSALTFVFARESDLTRVSSKSRAPKRSSFSPIFSKQCVVPCPPG